MKSFLEMVRSNMVVQAVLSIALGLLLAFAPDTTVLTIVYLLAGYLAVTGGASLFSYFRGKDGRRGSQGVLVTSIFFLIVALLVFLFPEAVGGVFSLVLGILLVLSGLVNVVRALELRSYHSNSWIAALVVSLVVAIGGVVIIVNPFETTVTFVLVLGILLIIKGTFDLVIEVILNKATKDIR